MSVFSAEQLQALALLFLKVNDRGAGIALVFFGFYAILTGYLIIKSTFLPRMLGVLSVFGGFGWLTFLYPPLGGRLFPFIAIFAILGAAALIFWLLVIRRERTTMEGAGRLVVASIERRKPLSTDHVPHRDTHRSSKENIQ